MSQVFRMYEPGNYVSGVTIALSEENHHVVSRVLRKNTGDSIVLLNGNGQVAFAKLEINKKISSATIENVQEFGPLLPSVQLWIGCLKGEKLHWVIQKSTELGVCEIVLFQSEHSIAVKTEGFIDKASKIAIEAIRQSGNPFLPKISYVKDLQKATWRSSDQHLNVVLDETASTSFREVMKNHAHSSFSLFVGPEGGFSANEREFFRSKQCCFIKIAPYILRADTASVSAVSLFRASF